MAEAPKRFDERAVPLAALAALGIVYGDLGTSPLYTMQAILGSLTGQATAQSALGVLSLIFWTLTITISVKYCLFVMRADNHGEGGILALTSMVGMNNWTRGTFIGASMGLLGAALIYGDGVITPAISVLSALEGVNVATPVVKPYILPIAVGILVVLFAAQKFGTAAIGKAFGPIMLAWFVVIGLLGLRGIVAHPMVLQAVNPLIGLHFLISSGPVALAILGGVFLCATGGEALYADMGHFGAVPIRWAWFAVVLPGLLLSYAGQAALLIDGVPSGQNPFFLLAPSWAVIPLVVLATVATIIASQAIITGAFSMTRQAMQLGWLPGFRIRQTSDEIYGQIYVPMINLMMAIATITIALVFRSSDRLAGAYGTAVSTTMVLTTLLLFRAMHHNWRWPFWVVIPFASLFLIIDLGFFAANLAKIVDGGWIPLSLGVIIFSLMVTWRTGIQALRARLAALAEPADRFFAELEHRKVPRVPGTAIFLSRANDQIPTFIAEYVRDIGALHEQVIAVTVQFVERPRADDGERVQLSPLAQGLWYLTLRYGFIEVPDIVEDLVHLEGLPHPIDLAGTVFFATRDIVFPAKRSLLSKWQIAVFSFLYKNAVRSTDRFNLPAERTMEVARHIEI